MSYYFGYGTTIFDSAQEIAAQRLARWRKEEQERDAKWKKQREEKERQEAKSKGLL